MNNYFIALADMHNRYFAEGQYVEAGKIATYLWQHGAKFYYDPMGRIVMGCRPVAVIAEEPHTTVPKVFQRIRSAIKAVIGSLFDI